jgi:hypothetical protein
MSDMGLRVNTPNVMHEVIDGEVIIIDLASGSYYSVRGTGADVWQLIGQSAGISTHALAAALSERYATPAAEIETSLQSFVAQLGEEGLVAETAPAVNGTTPASSASNGPAFTAPQLEKYTDLQDLVLLDPVHQVDQTGWPAPAPDGKA